MLGHGLEHPGQGSAGGLGLSCPPGWGAHPEPGLPELLLEPLGRETIQLESKCFSGSYSSSALPARVLVTLRSLHFVFFLPD